MRKRLRIFYAAGPGNVIGTYRHWKQRRDDPSQLAVTYSGQFYEVVNELGAKAFVIASCPMRDRVRDNDFHIEHWPIPFEDHSGPLYHLGQFIYGVRLIIAALLFRSDVAVVCGGTHWFILSVMSIFGIRVVPSLHCMLWRAGSRPGQFRYAWVRRFLRTWDGWFFRNHTTAILSVSAELTAQVRSLQTSGESEPLPPIYTFTPIYRRGAFDRITVPPVGRPFRVLYIGRIERNKGVFDLSRVALRLANEGHTDIEFDLCGSGSATAELRRCVEATGIGARFRLHGHCNQKRLAGFLSNCHVVIAPTQCDFLEGFNKVVVEGVLSHRPVITSSICPSLSLVREAALEVRPNDVQGYGDAIIRLRDDPELYDRLVAGGRSLSAQFYDRSISWGETLRSVLRTLQPAEQGFGERRRVANQPHEPHGRGQGWPARMSYAGVIAAVAMGLLIALMGRSSASALSGRQFPVSTASGTTQAHLGTDPVALQHQAARHETQSSLTVLP